MLTLIMLFTIIVTAIGQTDTVTLTNSNSVSSTLRTVTNTLRTRTESATATESWSLSATESLRTSTATESVSLSVGTRTLTHPITVTPVADVVSVSLFITPSAVQFPGDIPFAAESWRHRLATSFVVSPSRVVVYWNPDSGTQNISLSISFTGDCEPCCGCVPSDPAFRRNGLTNVQLHQELLWEVVCCPNTCGLEGMRVGSGFCSDLGIIGQDEMRVNCSSYPESALCFTNSNCGWGGSVVGCTSLPAAASTASPSSDDENYLPVIISGVVLVVVVVVACILYSCCRKKNTPTPSSLYEPTPNDNIQPVTYRENELSILPASPPSPRKSQGHTITRTWLDKGWV